MIQKIVFFLFTLCAACMASAQTTLFHTGDDTGSPYRIPAIAKAVNGNLIALSDWRPCGKDIGFGRVDIVGRISTDNGATWSNAFKVLEGSGQGADAGYGDACLVADSKRNELLLVCVSGNVPYWQSSPKNRQRMVTLHARYNKKTRQWVWDNQVADITAMVYDTVLKGNVDGLFMGSGRICQSRQVKVGKYHRLYASLCTLKGNFVIYSDDFGRTWGLLGDCTQSCAPKGDEPKCEELPDGSVLLSSRKEGGRYYNVYTYTDVKQAQGKWAEVVDSRQMPGGISNQGTPCNGEVLILPVRRTADGHQTMLALQSLPAGPQRSHVTIYYKELTTPETYSTPERFASHWNGAYQVTDKLSAYSTMIQQADGRIAFFYEEEPGEYQMVYRAIDLKTLTQGQFEAR